MNARRARLGPWRAACAGCAPRFRARRLWKFLSLALLILAAFAVGRYSMPPRTVYLLGTPLEPLAVTGEAEVGGVNDETIAVCGAPTKSGKPCQRKVKGGGYCYQHRDKYGEKNANRKSQ